MSTYKVSIIIPIYNVKPYIEECLQSVANQTMTEGIECILVDDCGTDVSMIIAQRFVDEYKGRISFSVYHHDTNRGAAAARNTGIRVAKGEYLFFMDSDDFISDRCIECLYSFVQQHPGVHLVQGSYIEDNSNSFKTFPNYSEQHCVIKHCLLTYNGKNLVPHNRLVQRQLIVDKNIFFKEGVIHEDNLWVFFLAKYVKSMAFTQERTYYYRPTPNSITRDVKIDREILSYRTIIETTTSNIDPLLSGKQKEFILENLITALQSKYYLDDQDRRGLINIYQSVLSDVVVDV